MRVFVPRGYSLHSVSAIRPGTGQATVVDADGDGNLDIVFPVCFPADTCAQENAIHIFYNQVRPRFLLNLLS